MSTHWSREKQFFFFFRTDYELYLTSSMNSYIIGTIKSYCLVYQNNLFLPLQRKLVLISLMNIFLISVNSKNMFCSWLFARDLSLSWWLPKLYSRNISGFKISGILQTLSIRKKYYRNDRSKICHQTYPSKKTHWTWGPLSSCQLSY